MFELLSLLQDNNEYYRPNLNGLATPFILENIFEFYNHMPVLHHENY